MAFLELFLDHILCFVGASEAVAGQGLGSADLSPAVQLLLLIIVSTLLSLLLLLLLVHLNEVFLVGQGV